MDVVAVIGTTLVLCVDDVELEDTCTQRLSRRILVIRQVMIMGQKAATVGPNLRMSVKVSLFSPLNSSLPWVPDNIFNVPSVCFSIGINYGAKKPLTQTRIHYARHLPKKGRARAAFFMSSSSSWVSRSSRNSLPSGS